VGKVVSYKATGKVLAAENPQKEYKMSINLAQIPSQKLKYPHEVEESGEKVDRNQKEICFE
jgi:hypothetical protein